MKESLLPVSLGEHEALRIQSAVACMREQFARELTPELAYTYVTSLEQQIGPAASYEEFVEKGKELHKKLGRDIYGPLIVGFLGWAEAELARRGISEGPVHFALRDAWPFYTAASILWDGTGPYHAVGTYLNRPLLGIEDEIAPEQATVNGYVANYLRTSGIKDNGTPVSLVDSGAWGTVVRAVKETYLPQTPLHPLFWYSHNPHIQGFLNEYLAAAGLPEEFGEVLNDSLECVFPQQYRRPVAFETEGGSRSLRLEQADELSVAWGRAALQGVMEAAHMHKAGIDEEAVQSMMRNVYALSCTAREDGVWTGVLPTHTPTWSRGEAFLASWPEDLLP